MSLRLGLVGDPVSHSLSPVIHAAALRELGVAGTYEARRVPSDGLRSVLAEKYDGLNVTIPHKEAMATLVSSLSPEAREIGAVNVIVFANGATVGHNTDAWAIGEVLSRAGFSGAGANALVLGAGGAARAVVHALSRAGFSVQVTNRGEARAKALAADFPGVSVVPFERREDALASGRVVVNATSVGLASDESPLRSWASARSETLAIELVYRPLETRFLREARAHGLMTVDGLDVLVWQAFRSLELWLGRSLDRSLIDVMRRAAWEAL